MAKEKQTERVSDKNKASAQKGKTAENKRSAKSEPAKKTAPKKNDKAPAFERGSDFIARPIRIPPDPDSAVNKLLPYLFVLCAVLVLVFLFSGNTSGILGKIANTVFFGLFGYGAWAIPVILVAFGIRWRKIVEDDNRLGCFIFALLLAADIACIIHTFYTKDPTLKGLYSSGTGGGLIGGFLSFAFVKLMGRIATFIVIFLLCAVFIMLLLSVTPKDIWIYVRYTAKVSAEKRAERREKHEFERAAEEERLERLRVEREEARRAAAVMAQAEAAAKEDAEEYPHPVSRSRKKAELPPVDMPAPIINLPMPAEEESAPDPIDEIAPSVMFREDEEEEHEPVVPPAEEQAPAEEAISEETEKEAKKEADKEEPANGKLILPDLEDIFGISDPDEVNALSGLEDPDELPDDIVEAKQNAILEGEAPAAPAPAVPKPKPEYRIPPISLLAMPEKPKSEDMTAEMQANAQRLVETLASFRVYTKITSISVGPTVTRYELQPEAGTSVKSIANRVDDIALSLASTGVRIEAPIPGKAAVGIEVPNKTAAIVNLRELIASKQFTCEENKKRKLMACLGVDVAGAPVFCDISKMPHMLVAGATGMGKSVCINSLLISLLYRTSPDDLRLILVDPKRVELGTYNGIPHLLIPVVTEPQKAAGALSWAVNEMERRFGLIEEVGARNIGDYNATVSGVPDYEQLPYIVIIIDELADLMLVAKDAVENSINRLAAKARAAGIHLVIGTQRPSVDVITGLIKANIPSRIAFTVASQTDSRTIIDLGGAERLNGRGDMLYAPVGLMKPMRVQGSFVSTEEVERVTAFVRSNAGGNEYSEEILADIEREAQRCTSSKSSAVDDDLGGDDDELDPKFRQALELAVNNNKIATSMLQRGLKVGYGRAARIIDQMERCGYVGPPDGTKPRDVLISAQQFRELVVSGKLGERSE